MRQEAFQYHPTLWIRHEVPCFVMSQSIEQQQGKVLTEHQHVQGACSGQGGGDGVKPHLCVFQSLVMLSPGSCRAHPVWPSGHCWGTGPLCSCFQLPAPAQAWPSSAPHGHCSPHHSLCQPEHRAESLLATTQVSAAETCTHKVHSKPSFPGPEGTGLLTILVLTSRGREVLGSPAF